MHAIWILPDGRRLRARAEAGRSLMEAAVIANIPGIAGDCGGTLSCATCHVLVNPAWQDLLEPVSDYEDAMLEGTETPRAPGSRLSCQLFMEPALDGIVLQVPGGDPDGKAAKPPAKPPVFP